MSNRPSPTPSKPYGTSTKAKGTKTRESKIARAKRHQLSCWPICAVSGKHINKQGFPQTIGSKNK